jgi:integrase/recombinase XerC
MSTAGHPEVMTATPADLHHLGAWLTHLELAGHPATTVATYRSVLTRAARELPHGLCAEPPEIVAWLGAHRAANTRAGYATALRAFYRWCLAGGRITVDPTAGLPVPRQRRGVPRPVTDAELAALLGRARQPVATWCTLAAYAGLRCCEVSRLAAADITEQVVYVLGKGDKPRAVPTHPLVWAAAVALPPGPVAGGRTPATVSHRIAGEARRLGLAGVTAHRLRHHFATRTLEAGGNLRVTQELLGHSSPATTAVYTQVSDVAMRAAVLGLPCPTLAT